MIITEMNSLLKEKNIDWKRRTNEWQKWNKTKSIIISKSSENNEQQITILRMTTL